MATLKEIALAASTLGDCEQLHADDVRKLGKAYLNELQKLEAQHRKTWALAQSTFSQLCWDEINDPSEAERKIIGHPCPPIEATKDK